MPLQAGGLKHRITIQRPIPVADPDYGDKHPTWMDVKTVWAKISDLSVRELIAAQAPHSKVTTRITIRYLEGVDNTMRALHVKNGVTRVYNIEGVLDDPDSGLEYMTLAVSNGVNDG